jgi:enoyl-CoA hydratase
MSAYENVLVETRGKTTRIAVNRPRALNALNRATLSELIAAFDALPAGTRVVVLTGAGEKAFVAGADIAEMADLTPSRAAAFSAMGHALGERIEGLDQPVIAEVNGYALGGGCELMLACDFAIAGDAAKFGQPEVGLGVIPGFGGTTRLGRRVGLARARQLVLTGDRLSAADALAWGLVNEVVPQAELRARVDALAERIAQNAPLAVAAAKRSTGAGAETDLTAANQFEQQLFALCFATADQKEGMRAFVEKRKAVWKGE